MRLTLRTAAALGLIGLGQMHLPQDIGKCCCVYLGCYRGTSVVVSASVSVTLACSQ